MISKQLVEAKGGKVGIHQLDDELLIISSCCNLALQTIPGNAVTVECRRCESQYASPGIWLPFLNVHSSLATIREWATDWLGMDEYEITVSKENVIEL